MITTRITEAIISMGLRKADPLLRPVGMSSISPTAMLSVAMVIVSSVFDCLWCFCSSLL